MTIVTPPRALLLVLTLLIAVGAPALETMARGKKQPAVEAPPPPPPPAPAGPVGLPDRLIDDAASYETYLEKSTATTPGFSSGAQVADALRTGAAYEPKSLVRGAVAYAAVAVLADRTFIASLRAAGNTPENRRLMAGYLLTDPTYAFNFADADAAAALAKQTLGTAGLRLWSAGRIVRKSAYDMQHQAWSKADVVDRSRRLSAVEGASLIAPAPDLPPVLRRMIGSDDALPVTAPRSPPPYSPLVARALQLAAIAALGEASDEAYDRLTTLTTESNTEACLHMAKINLYQCLAVAKPHYEDVFCLGQHILLDTGACLARNVGYDLPPEPLPPEPAPTKAHGRAKARKAARA